MSSGEISLDDFSVIVTVCRGPCALSIYRNKFGGQLPVYIAHSRDDLHHMSRLLRVGALDSETLQHTSKRLQINI